MHDTTQEDSHVQVTVVNPQADSHLLYILKQNHDRVIAKNAAVGFLPVQRSSCS